MKTLLGIIALCLVLWSCQSNNTSSNTASANSESAELQPAANTVVAFLTWYRDNYDSVGMMNLVTGNPPGDPNSNYAVDFPATEVYLGKLKASGYISDQYVKTWRTYFIKCDEEFKAEPQNDGPPSGFDYDFVMNSQDFDDDFKNIGNTRLDHGSLSGNKATVFMELPMSGQLRYDLTKTDGKWLIDEIKYPEEEN